MPQGSFRRAARARLSALAFLGLAAACSAAPEAPTAPPPAEPAAPASPPVDPAVALATFDDVWTTVRDSHFDPTLNGVDWNAVRDELRPRAEQVTTQAELYEVVGEMLERLGQSHFAMLPRSGLPPLESDEGDEGAAAGDGAEEAAAAPDALPASDGGDLCLEVRLRGGEMLVTKVAPGGPADAAGVRPGWILARFDGEDLRARAADVEDVEDPRAQRHASFAAQQELAYRMLGPVGSEVTCVFEDGDGRDVERALRRVPRKAEAHNFGTNLPTFHLAFESEVLERRGARIGRIHFTNWFLPMMEPFNAAVDGMRDCDGIVIDLRGNTGGAGVMAMGVAGHFFAERADLGTMTTRDSVMKFAAMPQKVNAAGERVEPFAGPVAILTDDMTGSTSEVFAGGMQASGRARTFGETTAGAVLPATLKTLPNGDALLYAMGDFKTPDGQLLEGRGVIPDVPVPLTREALLAQGDPALEAAVAWITGAATD